MIMNNPYPYAWLLWEIWHWDWRSCTQMYDATMLSLAVMGGRLFFIALMETQIVGRQRVWCGDIGRQIVKQIN